jgi:hypothetical protein
LFLQAAVDTVVAAPGAWSTLSADAQAAVAEAEAFAAASGVPLLAEGDGALFTGGALRVQVRRSSVAISLELYTRYYFTQERRKGQNSNALSHAGFVSRLAPCLFFKMPLLCRWDLILVQVAGGENWHVALIALPPGATCRARWPTGSFTLLKPLTGMV